MDRKDSSVYAGCLCVKAAFDNNLDYYCDGSGVQIPAQCRMYYRINKKREQTMNAV